MIALQIISIIICLTVPIEVCQSKGLLNWFGFGTNEAITTTRPLTQKNEPLEATCIFDGTGVVITFNKKLTQEIPNFRVCLHPTSLEVFTIKSKPFISNYCALNNYEHWRASQNQFAGMRVQSPDFDPNYFKGNIISTLHLKESGGRLFIDGVIYGLPHDEAPNLHGFHIHEYGKVGSRCLDAGGHFNPQRTQHGGPKDKVRHIGDLGNVQSNHGKIFVNIQDTRATLSGKHSVLGKAIVLHAKRDDLGLGETKDSLRTGNAGSRLACCVIKLNDWKTYSFN